MRIEVIQEKFAKALVHINKAVSNRPNIPVLNNVLIVANSEGVLLSSTDLDIGINANIGADVKEVGQTTVSARLLSEFVSTLKGGKISLELKDQKLVVKSVDNEAEFFTIPAEDFPTVPVSDGDALVKLSAQSFSRALDQTTFSASSDNSRPVLTGLLCKISKRKLMLVSVDGFRLSQKVMKIENGPEEDFQEIVPARSLDEVNKIIKDMTSDNDEISIYAIKTSNQLIFKIGEIELATRLVEGEYPKYEDILPKDKQYGFSVLKSELADAVKIVNIFAKNVIGNKARFSVDSKESKLKLGAVVVDIGKNETQVGLKDVLGEDMETAYNARFLHEMINSMKSEEILFETNGVTAPGVFRDKKDKEYMHVIMPMRLE